MSGVAVVGDMVAVPWLQHEPAAVLEFGDQLAVEHQEYMAAAAPVVCDITARIFHQPDTYVSQHPGAPARPTGFPRMLRLRLVVPIHELKGTCG